MCSNIYLDAIQGDDGDALLQAAVPAQQRLAGLVRVDDDVVQTRAGAHLQRQAVAIHVAHLDQRRQTTYRHTQAHISVSRNIQWSFSGEKG